MSLKYETLLEHSRTLENILEHSIPFENPASQKGGGVPLAGYSHRQVPGGGVRFRAALRAGALPGPREASPVRGAGRVAPPRDPPPVSPLCPLLRHHTPPLTTLYAPYLNIIRHYTPHITTL